MSNCKSFSLVALAGLVEARLNKKVRVYKKNLTTQVYGSDLPVIVFVDESVMSDNIEVSFAPSKGYSFTSPVGECMLDKVHMVLLADDLLDNRLPLCSVQKDIIAIDGVGLKNGELDTLKFLELSVQSKELSDLASGQTVLNLQ